MRVLLKQNGQMVADLTFEQEALRAGSDPSSEIYLNNKAISEHHLRISPYQGAGWVVETVSRKPIPKLNGVPMSARANLHDGDRIELLDYMLTVFPTWDAGREKSDDADTKLRHKPLPTGTLIRRHMEKVEIPAGWLDKISRIAMELGLCTDLNLLMDYSINMLASVFGAGFSWFGARRRPAGRLEFVEGRLVSGQTCDLSAFGDALVHHSITRSQHLCVPKADDPVITSGMAVPLMSPEGNIGVVYVDTRTETQSYKPHHLDLMSLIGSLIASRLEQIMHGQVQVETELAGGELNLTRAVQARLDPKSVPQSDKLAIVAYSKPGDMRSGDVFDIVRMASGVIAFFFGHVTAEGFETAITMAEARAAFRTAMLHGDGPQVFVRALNWLVHDLGGDARIDCGCFLIDPTKGSVRYAIAGSPIAVAIDGQGQALALPNGNMPPIGETSAPNYQGKTAMLPENGSLVLASPGMETARNADGESLDPQRFIDAVCDGIHQSPRTTLDDAINDVSAYLREGDAPDDVTVFLFRRT